MEHRQFGSGLRDIPSNEVHLRGMPSVEQLFHSHLHIVQITIFQHFCGPAVLNMISDLFEPKKEGRKKEKSLLVSSRLTHTFLSALCYL